MANAPLCIAETGRQWRWTLEIIKRPAGAKGFVTLPRHRVVEGGFARLGRCRRLAEDFEGSIESAVARTAIAPGG